MSCVYFWLEENLVTDFVPSEMACLASSPGRMRRTAVWISREEIVDFFEYDESSVGGVLSASKPQTIQTLADSLEASVAIRSKMSLTNEFRMAIALFEIPVSGWTCLRTRKHERDARVSLSPDYEGLKEGKKCAPL